MRRVTLRSAYTFIALCVGALSSTAFAQAAGQSAGLSPPYFVVSPPETVTTTDKIEVVEIFSYACIHCAQFQDHVDAWRKTVDSKKVAFVYLPSPYNAVDQMLARGYFAADALSVVDKTHHAMFQALHERGVQIKSLDDVVALYAQLGIPADRYSKAMKDFFVDTQLRRAYDLMVRYKVDGTPTLIVAGKYRITADSAGGQESMFKVVNKLIAQELTQNSGQKSAQKTGQSTATSLQAPNKGK